jgi:trimeric autotransporter adhesin
MNKKLFVLLPAVMLALTGCGENPSSSSSSSSSDTSTTSESSSSSSSESSSSSSSESSSSSSSESSSSSSSESSSSSSSESSSSSSTDPVVSVSTIAEVYALAAEQAVVIEGSVTAVTAKGIVVADATGAIYAYKGTDTGKAVGDFVRVSGTTSTYHGNRQISKDGIVIAAGEGTDPHIAVPEGSAMTLASWDAFSIASSRLTMITGLVKVYKNGTYYNLKFVDGTDYSEATKYARESVSTIGVAENVDKYYDVKAYLIGSDTAWNEMIIVSSTEHAVHATGVECVADKSSVYVGDTVNLSANLTPSAAADAVTYQIASGSEFATIAGSVLTATADGTVTVTATANGVVSAAISIVIAAADPVASLVITSAPTAKKYGETLTASELVVKAVRASGAEDAAFADYTCSVTLPYTFVEADGESKSITVSVGSVTSDPVSIALSAPVSVTYSLVSDASTLAVGDVLVLASNTGFTAGDFSGTNVFLSSVASTFAADGSTISSLGADSIALTLGGASGAWTLSYSSKLLGATAAKKAAWDSGDTSWDISIDSATGNATIQSATTAYGRILYNVSSPRFLNYASATGPTMLLPQLYRAS